MREKITMAWRGKCPPVEELALVEVRAPVVPPAAPVATLVAPAKATEQDPLELCLELWKIWMADGIDRDLGMQTMRGLQGDGDGHGIDIHEAQRANDIKIAQATDAMIDSMLVIHRWAIYRLCSLASPWRFPNASLVTVGEEARSNLRGLLKENVCTAILF